MPHASSHERPAGPWATLILMKPRYGPSQSAGSYGALWILRSHRLQLYLEDVKLREPVQ